MELNEPYEGDKPFILLILMVRKSIENVVLLKG